MAQERGNAHAAAMWLLILGLQSWGLWHSASAATHTVGGSQRWDVGIDYTTWAAGQTFKVGDILFFPYTLAEHNVVVVNKAGYDACSGADAIATFNDGNTNVTISTAGTHYYLCSVIGHCGAGMKLAVTVPAAAAAPTTPPTTPPTPASSPPRTAPSPSLSPFAAPSSTPTPVLPPSSPAPTPSAEAPTPSSPGPVSTVGPPASSPGAPLSSPPPPPPNSASSFLLSAAIAPLVALLVAVTL